jgi:tetratricopeptide (TPR) repeat protein
LRVLDLVRARLDSLSETEQRVLAAGAVIGRPFGLRLLRLVSGLPELQALDAVDQVLRRGFLDERSIGPNRLHDDPALAYRHAYAERAVYEGLSGTQRRALHRRAADALLQLARARPEAAVQEVAYHLERAGDPEAVTYLLQAARQAQALYAYRRAVELCDRALDFLDRMPPDDAVQRFDLLLVREAVLDRQGLRAEQAADVAELMRLAEEMEDTERLAMASIREAGYLVYVGRYDAARQAGERALALYRAAGDPIGEGQALRELGFLGWAGEDYSAALAYGREALQLARRQGDAEGEATALHNLAEVHRSLGSPRQSIGLYENALELYWARQDRQRQGVTLYGLGTAYRQLGELEGAAQRYRQALEVSAEAGDRLMVSRVHHALGGVHWQRGERALALEQMRQGVETSREIGYGPGIAHGLLALSHLQSQVGDLVVARELLADAITWLRLTEDGAGLQEAEARQQQLRQETPVQVALLHTEIGWVKSHVALAEGKVYCAFESPLAHCAAVGGDDGRRTTDDG